MSPLRVAVVAQSAVRREGQGRVVLELVRQLVERGHVVTLYAHRIDDSLSGQVAFRKVRELWPQTLDDLWMFAATTRALRRAPCDVACVVGPSAMPPGAFVLNAQFSHRGWRDSWTAETRPSRYHRLHTAMMARIEAAVARRASRIVASAPRLALEMTAGADVPVDIVPNGIDLAEFAVVSADERAAARARLGVATDAFAIAFLGEFRTPRKGLDPLLRAMAAGPAHEVIVVAGQGPEDTLRQRATQLGLAERVLIVGLEPSALVLAACDVAAVPSPYEPFSLVALEAAARRLPVVISAAAGASSLLGDAAVVVDDPTDAAALRAALDRLHADPALGAAMGEAGRRVAEGLTWPATMAQAAEVIEKVASDRPTP